MERERLLRAREIFAAAADKREGERTVYVRAECGDDSELHHHITSLLLAHDRAGGFLAGATVGAFQIPGDPQTVTEGPGTVIGRYKLLQLIGEGGFGVVYMAEQEHPVRRKVALKVIKPGMDTRQVVARFEAERQALALMEHPNIARVLDGGATESGRPYFVMELVKGVPLTEYCDQQMLTNAQRLELFLPVCRAVQHAHQKGVIHRDLKPSNVLVTMHDGLPVPKVIDFGIAKATRDPLTDKTLFTEFRQLVGTPAYMSPEQAEMNGLDVDTRTDIYSLGVLLYELLTGTTPFDATTLRAAAYGEIQRIIREVDPPAPSTRLDTLGDALRAVAERRGTEPARLGPAVRGELDWIVMKALEKDRSRRYDTASALAEDVLRYLRDEAVLARPPGGAYLARKFVRRHRAAIATASVVAAALTLGLAVATTGFVRASRDRDRAVSARTDEQIQRVLAGVALAEAQQARADAETARQHAEDARTRSVGVNDLLHELFAAVNRRRTGDGEAFHRILTGAAAKVDAGALVQQPELEAAVRTTLANVLFSYGYQDEGEGQIRRALEIRRGLAPEGGSTDLAESLCDLGWLLQRKGDLEGAERYLREGLDLNRKLLGDKSDVLATNLHSLAVVLIDRGKRDEGVALVKESLGIRMGECDAAVAATPGDAKVYTARAQFRARTGDFAGALEDYSAAIDRNPDDHWNWFFRAPLRLYLGDEAGYRADCERMTELFLGSARPEISERAIKTCLLSPEPAADLGTLREPMHRVLSASMPMSYVKWFQVCKGMYEYRAGRYDSAVGWLSRGREGLSAAQGRALADFYAAMALHRLGKAPGAERALASGIKLTPDDPLDLAHLDPYESGSTIANWVIARIARREAEELIRGKAAPGPADGAVSGF